MVADPTASGLPKKKRFNSFRLVWDVKKLDSFKHNIGQMFPLQNSSNN